MFVSAVLRARWALKSMDAGGSAQVADLGECGKRVDGEDVGLNEPGAEALGGLAVVVREGRMSVALLVVELRVPAVRPDLPEAAMSATIASCSAPQPRLARAT